MREPTLGGATQQGDLARRLDGAQRHEHIVGRHQRELGQRRLQLVQHGEGQHVAADQPDPALRQPGALQRFNRVVEDEVGIGDLAVGEADAAVIRHVDQQLGRLIDRQHQEGVGPRRPVALEIRDEGEVGVEVGQIEHVRIAIERAAAARGDQEPVEAAGFRCLHRAGAPLGEFFRRE